MLAAFADRMRSPTITSEISLLSPDSRVTVSEDEKHPDDPLLDEDPLLPLPLDELPLLDDDPLLLDDEELDHEYGIDDGGGLGLHVGRPVGDRSVTVIAVSATAPGYPLFISCTLNVPVMIEELILVLI